MLDLTRPMKRVGRTLGVLSLPLLLACNQERVAGPAARPEPMPLVLRVGERAFIPEERLEVGFERVTGDSRCPRNVLCIWAGAASVRVWIRHPWDDPTFREIEIPAGPPGEGVALGYRITAERLDPYPEEPGPTPQPAYVLTLRVEPLGR